MTDGVHKGIDAGHHFAGAGGDHGGAGRQQGLIPKSADERHHPIWRPGAEEQEADGDGRLGYPDFSSLLAFVHIRAQ